MSGGIPMIPKRRWLMIQICQKDKEKVYEAIRTGKIDAAEMSFPNLIDDILLTMKGRGLTGLLAQALPDKRRDNSHIPFDILLCLAVAAKLKRKTSLTDVPFAVTEAELLAELGWNLWDNERVQGGHGKLLSQKHKSQQKQGYVHYSGDHRDGCRNPGLNRQSDPRRTSQHKPVWHHKSAHGKSQKNISNHDVKQGL